MARYNTGPFASRVIINNVEGLGLTPEVVARFEAISKGVDDTLVEMLAVTELSRFLPIVRGYMEVTPLIYPGVYDTDTDKLFMAGVEDWSDFSKTPYMLVAGHHAEAGNRPKLAEDCLQRMLDDSVKVYSQVSADITPHQAEWVSDKVEELGLTAVALRAHPFHGARAYLTQLATFTKRGLDRRVVLLPWWRPFNPFGKRALTAPWSDEVWSDATLVPGEAKRIYDYSAKGDVATLEELSEYCDWLFHRSPVAHALSRFS